MLNNYETTFVMTPVLSEEDVKRTISGYIDFLKKNDAEIVNEEYWGLKQLAYPIAKKTTGIYHHLEFRAKGEVIDRLELMFRRDEDNVLRFLTIKLDKYAVQYNENRRKGLAGKNRKDKNSNPVKEDSNHGS